MKDEDKKIIDSNRKNEEIHMIHFTKPLNELPCEDNLTIDDMTEIGTFTEGLNAKVIDKFVYEDEEKLLQEQGDRIISEAKEKALEILEIAKNEAEIISQDLYEEAQKKGYEDGLQNGMSEVNQTKKELEELAQTQNQNYLEQIETLEPQFANILTMLIEKITGIIIEDKKEVILYLIHNAIVGVDSSKTYNVRTSKDDYDFVLSKKNELSSYVSNEIIIDVTLDYTLGKNQCFIETDTRIIDCSLDVQLNNLIQDIKLLSK